MAEQLNTYQGETQEDPNYQKEMVEKAEAAIQPPATEEVQDRPDWLPEKFNTPEDMAKAYSELEQQFHSSREEANEAPGPNQLLDAGKSFSKTHKVVTVSGTRLR